ncbi:benzoate-CoA ligase family protein [Hahella sp. HN01]|uniref:benzoate-CoA ligase family protein n=1 Tax=Hahella sp. HN01 TaxID=2847262 RepID=UPI001C1EEF7C|nr:benzoate-CoA ligase family protein [Hahella sp. HN01]MBU6950865.1 benzoate-CoA ligase family protein [Hahella sp. HN01]
MVASNLDPISVDVVVVGGGIAGCWTALKLLRKGIPTAIAFYSDSDRGGKLGASALSVGAINTSPLTRGDYLEWLTDLGRGQEHSDVGAITRNHLASELDALLEFDALKNIQLGVALKSGSGRHLLARLLQEIRYLGGVVLDNAWVTRIVADAKRCHGVQYQSGDQIGAVYAGAVVLASGGYSGLFHGSVKTGTYGSVHGRHLAAGGWLSNLEFVFKHGYGQPDLGTLTPTEELPGAEIYDENGEHVDWLEQELFYGRGTSNHFQAFMTWRKGGDLKYYVDFRYRELHRSIKRIAVVGSDDIEDICADKEALIAGLVERCPEASQDALREILEAVNRHEREYNFETFSEIKALVADAYPVDRSRIRQISYFSMGGVAHHKFKTNLKNVFVCGEAMHDYGAHRVGGLPWALYLCAAKVISEKIDLLKRQGHLLSTPFELDDKASAYDKKLVAELQQGLQRYQESGVDVEGAAAFADWIRDQRRTLTAQHRELDDVVAYLLVGEAIMRSSLARQESRGCFFRDDFGDENPALSSQRTLTRYDSESDEVHAELISAEQLSAMIDRGRLAMDDKSLISSAATKNAAYFLLKKHVETGLGGKAAVETLDVSYTYDELWSLTSRYAGFLKASRIDEGDRVALLLNDRPEYLAMFLATQQIGAIAIPLNTFSKEQELTHYLEDSGAKLLITEAELVARYSVEQINEQTHVEVVSYEDIATSRMEPVEDILPVSDETIGFILYTSGSTGKPKGAIHRQVSMGFSAENFARKTLKINDRDRIFSSSKLFFAYGLGNSLYFPLYFGATALLCSTKAAPEVIRDILGQLKPTVFFAVPAVYRGILEGGGATEDNFRSVRLCVSAGEALPIKLAQQWCAATGVEVLDGIGSTEALHIFCVSNHSSAKESYYGRAVPGYELCVCDENGKVLTENAIGELRVKGPTLAQGYWNNPAKTAETFYDGSLLTGDRYFANDKGEYVFVGRHGDTYKSSGLWVSTLEIEAVLGELAAVAESSVVVFQGNDGLLKSKAYVVAREAESFEDKQRVETDTHRFLRERLPKYKTPHCVEALDELPRTATGKIAKAILRDMAQEVIWARPVRESAPERELNMAQ